MTTTGRFVNAIAATPNSRNLAYRGTETHGVAITEDWSEVEPYGANETVVEIQPNEPEPEPIPVRVVSGDESRELRDIRFLHEYATDGPTRIVGKNEGRTNLKIRNLSAGTRVWLGSTESLAPFVGYPLDGGAEFSTPSQSDIWAMSGTPGTTVELAIAYDYTVAI
jgi:hypothetical protein